VLSAAVERFDFEIGGVDEDLLAGRPSP